MTDIRRAVRARFFRTWPVAAAALAGLLVLIGTTIVGMSHQAENIYAQLDELNRRQVEISAKLRRLRSDVHLSGIYIRDYLLDTNREHAPEYRQYLTELRRSHAATVNELRPLLPQPVQARIDNLENRLEDYWQTFEPLFDWTATEKIANSSRFLRSEVLPRREAVLTIAKEVEELNDANLATQRAEVQRRIAAFRDKQRQRLWRTLLLGCLVAVVAVSRLRTLEHRSDDERRRAEEAEGEMRALSQQLVAAQEQERKNVTRELHDHVGQMLTALRMEIGRADRARLSSVDKAGQALAEAKRLLDTILGSVRDLVMGLRPSMLDDFGLQPALEWHVRDFRRRFSIAVDLNIRGDLSTLTEPHRTCVYRVIQEAMTNCARHAHATRVAVEVAYDQSTLRLSVTDDGIGIDAPRTRGMGLLGIEERLRELNGSFRVGRAGGGGTEVAAVIPVAVTQEEARLARIAG